MNKVCIALATITLILMQQTEGSVKCMVRVNDPGYGVAKYSVTIPANWVPVSEKSKKGTYDTATFTMKLTKGGEGTAKIFLTGRKSKENTAQFVDSQKEIREEFGGIQISKSKDREGVVGSFRSKGSPATIQVRLCGTVKNAYVDIYCNIRGTAETKVIQRDIVAIFDSIILYNAQ